MKKIEEPDDDSMENSIEVSSDENQLKARTAKGTFAKGSKHAIGPRKPKSVLSTRDLRYQSAIAACVTDADWRRIINAAKEKAMKGDNIAREWLSRYLVRPLDKIDELTEKTVQPQITLIEYSGPVYNSYAQTKEEPIEADYIINE